MKLSWSSPNPPEKFGHAEVNGARGGVIQKFVLSLHIDPLCYLKQTRQVLIASQRETQLLKFRPQRNSGCACCKFGSGHPRRGKKEIRNDITFLSTVGFV